MKLFLRFSLCLTLMTACWFFFSAASFPTEPISKKETVLSKAQKVKLEKLEKRLEKASNPARKSRIKEKIKKITYGEQGDALGLAALIGGIISILLSVAVLTFLGMEWQLLVFIGLLLGAAAIIIGIVDLRYTDMPGQAFAAMVAGGLGIIAGIIALILVK
jgi:hypothetical protein